MAWLYLDVGIRLLVSLDEFSQNHQYYRPCLESFQRVRRPKWHPLPTPEQTDIVLGVPSASHQPLGSAWQWQRGRYGENSTQDRCDYSRVKTLERLRSKRHMNSIREIVLLCDNTHFQSVITAYWGGRPPEQHVRDLRALALSIKHFSKGHGLYTILLLLKAYDVIDLHLCHWCIGLCWRHFLVPSDSIYISLLTYYTCQQRSSLVGLAISLQHDYKLKWI